MAKRAEDVFRESMSSQARVAAEQRGKELVVQVTGKQIEKLVDSDEGSSTTDKS
jgi:hypothetical protein